jgi:hypothetical protein
MPPCKVTRKYIPAPGSADAPGEHYTLQAAEPDRHVSPAAYRQFSFYRSPRGGEVAGDLGYSGSRYWPLASDEDAFRQVKAAVEEYDKAEALSRPGLSELEGKGER